MRRVEDTAKLRRREGAAAAVGRKATAVDRRKSLDAMVIWVDLVAVEE